MRSLRYQSILLLSPRFWNAPLEATAWVWSFRLSNKIFLLISFSLSDWELLVLKELKGPSYLMLRIFCILCDHLFWGFPITNTNIAWSNVLRKLCLVSLYLNTEVNREPEKSDIPLTSQRATSRDNIAINYYTTFTNASPHYVFLMYLTNWNFVKIKNTMYDHHHHCLVGNLTTTLIICRNGGVFRELPANFPNVSCYSW